MLSEPFVGTARIRKSGTVGGVQRSIEASRFPGFTYRNRHLGFLDDRLLRPDKFCALRKGKRDFGSDAL